MNSDVYMQSKSLLVFDSPVLFPFLQEYSPFLLINLLGSSSSPWNSKNPKKMLFHSLTPPLPLVTSS